jgi:hypothetical protein
MKDRREFILKSSLTVGGFLFLNQLQAVPLFRQFIIATLNEDDEELLKKLLLQANGYETYKTLNYQDNINAYRTNYYSVFGEKDATGTYTQKTVDNIKTSKPVTLDELYRACNYKENPFMDDVFPKLNTLFQSAIIGFGTAGLAAYGTATLPVIIAELTLTGVGILNTGLIEGVIEKVKKDNIDLCKRTVEHYYKENKENKLIIESDEVTNKSKIPFKAEKKELENKLPETNPVKSVSKKINESNKEELLTTIVTDLTAYLKEWKKTAEEANTFQKRQDFLNYLNFIDSEISSGLFIGKTAIQILFNDSKLANDFYAVSMALKDAYLNYVKFTMPQPAIGTMAFAASWVSAGLTIMSLFSKNSEAELWKNLFKQLKELTELIIKGFTAVLENQKLILQQLNTLTEIVIKNGKIEQTLLRKLNDKLDELFSKIDLLEYNQSMELIINSSAQLNTLFNDRKFDIQKDDYRIEFSKYITNYVRHSTEISSNSGSICGYSLTTDGSILRELVLKNTPFEYQIGKIPIAISSLSTKPKYFTNNYISKIPNPIEWNRGIDLYLQANLIARPDSKYVKNHLTTFIETGMLLQKFLRDFIKKDFVTELAEFQSSLSLAVFDILDNYAKQRLLSKSFHKCLLPYKKSLKMTVSTLDRSAFTPIEPGKRYEYRVGSVAQRSAKRKKLYAAIEPLLEKNKLTVLFNEIDADDKFPDHRVDAFDVDVFDIFETAMELGIINFDKGSKTRSNGRGMYRDVPLYTCEFIDGDFKGIVVKFLEDNISYTRSFPIQEGSSPQDGKRYKQLHFGGLFDSSINPQSWRSQVKTILKNKSLDSSFYKLKKISSNLDNLDFSFIEFVINEIARKSDRIKNSISQELASDLDFLYRGNIDKSNELNIIGYLIINQLSIIEYNKSTSPYSDYRDIQLSGKAYNNYLVYTPKYAYFQDLVKIFNDVFSEDFLNENTHSEKWKDYKQTFTENPNDLTPIINFIKDNFTAIVTEQKNYLLNLDINDKTVNYNISNTLMVLTEFKKLIE